RRHLPGGRPDRPRLPVPGARLVPRQRQERVSRLRAGLHIEVHVNRRRPHHNEGRRVARLKPRFNADVNRWWLCDAGRYGFIPVDAADRLLLPTRRDGETTTAATWDEAIAAVAPALRRCPADASGVVSAPRRPKQDLIVR